MVCFVNAKINIGLHIVRRRNDGYHDLETVFYPVGIYAGTPRNPVDFCDVLEAVPGSGISFLGRHMDCPIEKNLVTKAMRLFEERLGEPCGRKLVLDKHLPDQAGLGGGSADAAFTLRILNDLNGRPFATEDLEEMAVRLGADCPVFIRNEAAYAEGVGERLQPVELSLAGKWLLVVKPDFAVSTKEAFAGVSPRCGREDLRELVKLPIEEWKGRISNDFETSIFPLNQYFPRLKQSLYDSGALYASLSGSGSALYGIYPDKEACERAYVEMDAPYKVTLML